MMRWSHGLPTADLTEPFCKPQGRFAHPPEGFVPTRRDSVWCYFKTGSEACIQQEGLEWAAMWAQTMSIVVLQRLLTVRTEWSRK